MTRIDASDERPEANQPRTSRTRRWAAVAMVGVVSAAPLTVAATGDDDGGSNPEVRTASTATETTELEAVARQRAEMVSKFGLLAEDASALADRVAAEQEKREAELKKIAAEREEQKALEAELKRIAAEREEQKALEAELKRIAAEREEQKAAEAAAAQATQPAPAVAAGSVWDRLAQCESGGNWSINTGNGYYGGLQFSLSSWRAVGGTGMPHEASRETQIAMGEKLKAVQGWGAWPACTRKLGLR